MGLLRRSDGRVGLARVLAVGLVFVLGAAPPPHEGADVPEFPTRVELVTVGVVVTDSQRRPVEGLTRGDFTLNEDGVPQTLSTFEAVEVPEAPRVAPPHRTVVSTNVPAEAAPPPGRWFGVVFDDLHLGLREAGYARSAVASFLEEAVREGDQVTLATTSGEVWWTTTMEAGREEILTLLDRVEARAIPDQGPDWITPYEAQRVWVHRDRAVRDYVERRFASHGVRRADLVIKARAPEVYHEALAHARQTLEVVERMLRPLEGAERPGALVLVSGGFIHDTTLAGFGRVLEASRRSTVPLHFVDARGLTGMAAHFGADQRATSVPGLPTMHGLDRPEPEPPPGAYTGFDMDRDEKSFGASGPESLALDSGGLIVHNTNNPSRGMRRIAAESRAYYLLGYHPTNAARDGTYRKVEVQVSRKGLDVRARKGYRAPLEGEARTGEGATPEEPWYQPALDSPLDVTALPLRVASHAFEEVRPNRARVVLTAEVDIRALELRDEAGRAADALDVLMLVDAPSRGERVREDVTAGLNLRPETRETIERTWFPVSRHMELPPGDFQARVVVRARNSGRIGSVVHRFEVPGLPGLRVSSVVLTDVLEPRPDWTMSGLRPRIVAHRAFPAGGVLFVHYEVYGAAGDPGTGRPRVRSGLEIRRRDGTVLGRGEPVAITPSAEGRLSRTSEVRLTDAGAGDYELVLSVTDDVTGQTLLVKEEFTLVDAGPSE